MGMAPSTGLCGSTPWSSVLVLLHTAPQVADLSFPRGRGGVRWLNDPAMIQERGQDQSLLLSWDQVWYL